MTRYRSMFDHLLRTGDGAFGVFLMLGDPDLKTSGALLDALVEAGANMIEVGIPFSDPIADGPVIQESARRALEAGTRVGDCLGILRDFRQRHPDVPLGILTYANLVVARGRDRFCSDLARAGVDSLLIADVPTLEAEPYRRSAKAAAIDLVMIAATNTPQPALERIATLSSGYTYCVARRGVTGTRDELVLDHGDLFTSLNRLGAPPPVLGFGISRPEHVAQALSAGAAGVICGSAITRIVASDRQPLEPLIRFVSAMKSATIGRGSRDIGGEVERGCIEGAAHGQA